MELRKLLVLYVPTLDRRWINERDTPTVYAMLQQHGEVSLETHPSTELLPSMVSGVWPGEHRLWQVRIPERVEKRSPLQRAIDTLPKVLTTTFQCVRHHFDVSYDLPTIEPRRRRRFVMHRVKVQRRHGGGSQVFDNHTTIFSVLGEHSRYRTLFSLDKLGSEGITPWIDGRPMLEFIELYAFDLFCHWNLDRPDAVRDQIHRLDALIAQACEAAERHGMKTLLAVDHGQEPVRHTIDLASLLKQSSVPGNDFTYYIEVANARFWFFTDRARDTLIPLLKNIERATFLHADEMTQYHVDLDASKGFGDAYLITDQGTAFFPHDFHHPLVNAYMARKTREQHPRKISPVHRGYHGHLPGPPADVGYLSPLSDGFARTASQGELIDVAPTLLSLLNQPVPETMKGKALLRWSA